MAYAVEHGIWPRPKPQPATGGDGAAPATGGDSVAIGGTGSTQPASISGGSLGARPPDDDTAAEGTTAFTAEGLLREALIRLWEQARARKVERIGRLVVRLFDPTDAFRLLGVIAAVRGADEKQVVIEGGYETTSGSSFEIAYVGTPQDAQPLKDFLEPQLRAADTKDLKARFAMTFKDGLPMTGDAAEKLTEQLTRFATGAAYVEATAEAAA